MDTAPPAQKLHQLTFHCRTEEPTCWSTQGSSSSRPRSGRPTCLDADFRSAAVPSPSFWSSSYFLWLCSLYFTHQENKQSYNGFNISKLNAFNSFASKYTFLCPLSALCPNHPPSALPTSTHTFFQTCSLLSLSSSSKILHEFLSVPGFLCHFNLHGCFL